jgi:serine/threonine protein kinase
MGVVYRGLDLVMQRPVAVKLVRTREGVRIDEAITGRFLREAKHTARIVHENIIDVFDLGRSEEGDLFFVMELLEGQTLSQVLQTQERLDPELAVHVGAQIADALDAAHRGGIVHRDLKPANVMLVLRGQDPAFVKVLDFGVAKAHSAGEAETALTRTGVLVGTIDYMAPEQILGRAVDGRTDIYSLGVLLYRIVTGTNPFRDPLMPAMIHNHLNVMPEPMQSRVQGTVISLALERAVEKCLRKDPKDRFAAMSDVAAALRASLRLDPSELPELGVSAEVEAELGDDPYDDGFSDDDKTRVQRRRETAVTRVHASRPPPRDATAVTRVSKPATPDVGVNVGPALGAAPPRAPERPAVPPTVASPARPAVPATVASPGLSAAPATVASPARPAVPATVASPALSGPDALPVLLASDEHEDFSAGKTRVDPTLRCAMCNTPNPRGSVHCAACGVGLHTGEQAAVRARVRPAEPAVPHGLAPHPGPFVQSPPSGGVHAPHMAGAPPPWPQTPPPAQPVSPEPPAEGVWARVLRWAGIRR